MPYTDQGWPNLPAMMLARAREWPTKPLFRFWRGKAWHSLNWAEFAGQVAALAATDSRNGWGALVLALPVKATP